MAAAKKPAKKTSPLPKKYTPSELRRAAGTSGAKMGNRNNAPGEYGRDWAYHKSLRSGYAIDTCPDCGRSISPGVKSPSGRSANNNNSRKGLTGAKPLRGSGRLSTDPGKWMTR